MRRTCFVLLAFAAVFGTAVSSRSQSIEHVLHNFAGGTDGADPLADLVYSPSSGFVYGTTNLGGGSGACTKGCGTVFEIRPDGTGYSVLHRFTGMINGDGANPQAALVIDSAGNLYGTTFNGGAHNLGTVFQLVPQPGGVFNETVLFSFSGANGSHPLARLVLDSLGNLYGTTLAGGTKTRGTVFQLTPTAVPPWKETVLHSFAGPDGANPRAGVIFDANGHLWGTTYGGGTSNLGVVFQMSPSGGETFLFSFAGPDGAHPRAAVTLDNAGNVFGTTQFGGTPGCTFATAGCGVVFELQPIQGGYSESVLYSFTGGTDGAAPIDDLTVVTDMTGSDVYGTASQAGTTGGACGRTGCGSVFELCSTGSSCAGAGTWIEYTLFDFNGKGGRAPAASIIIPSGTTGDVLGIRPPSGHGGCTSACMGPASGGGTAASGTVYQLTGP